MIEDKGHSGWKSTKHVEANESSSSNGEKIKSDW